MDVLEVLLELEYLRADLARHPLKAGSEVEYMTALGQLVSIMAMILKGTIGKDCLDHLGMISSGDMTSTNT